MKLHLARNLFLFGIITTLISCGGGGSDTPSTITPIIPSVPQPTPPVKEPSASLSVNFVNTTSESGLLQNSAWGRQVGELGAGVAAGDYDGDGDIDILRLSGDGGQNSLYQNQGDGTFIDKIMGSGLLTEGGVSISPALIDLDGDGDLDVLLGASDGESIKLFKQTDAGLFEDVTPSSGLSVTSNEIDFLSSPSFADYDKDGDLDIAWANGITNRTTRIDDANTHTLWRNDGALKFTNVSNESGLTRAIKLIPSSVAFASAFVDINNDQYPDLLLVADGGNTKYFYNNQDGTFLEGDRTFLTDKNGMGTATGDYDNDGDLDWLVTSISGLPEHLDSQYNGNRLYSNNGDGSFTDISDTANAKIGFWGWGACFKDFDNDGYLDIFHTNGWLDGFGNQGIYIADYSRLFMSDQNNRFVEYATGANLVDNAQGRGVICADFNNDGWIDVYIDVLDDAPKLFINDTDHSNRYLSVRLIGKDNNKPSLGAKIYVSLADKTLLREVTINSNYRSHNPSIVHFGVGATTTLSQVKIVWPNGEESLYLDIATNQNLVINQP